MFAPGAIKPTNAIGFISSALRGGLLPTTITLQLTRLQETGLVWRNRPLHADCGTSNGVDMNISFVTQTSRKHCLLPLTSSLFFVIHFDGNEDTFGDILCHATCSLVGAPIFQKNTTISRGSLTLKMEAVCLSETLVTVS